MFYLSDLHGIGHGLHPGKLLKLDEYVRFLLFYQSTMPEGAGISYFCEFWHQVPRESRFWRTFRSALRSVLISITRIPSLGGLLIWQISSFSF